MMVTQPGQMKVTTIVMSINFVVGLSIPVFLQAGFRLSKTVLKPVFSFTGVHRNLNFKPSEIL